MCVDAKLIGTVIKEYRKKSGHSQEVVSGLAGIDRTHYSKIERGERMPNIATLFKIAHALNVYPVDIIKTVEEKSKYSL